MCKEYNGYSNYFTWCVSLWLDNDEGNYHYVRRLRDSIIVSQEEGNHSRSLADEIKSFVVDTCNPLYGDASMYVDILGYSLSSVDWQEIADNIVADD